MEIDAIDSADDRTAEANLRDIINQEGTGEEFIKTKEQAIVKLGQLYVKQQRAQDIGNLLKEIRPFFDHIPKAKTAKLVRTLLDLVSNIPHSLELQIALCRESVAWCITERRTFLRHRIQAKLAALLLDHGEYTSALKEVTDLLREVKRLDDKPLLVEIYLVESRIHHKIKNLPKAKAALTSARTAGNAIYCPPPLQASIDTLAGTLHAEEKDFKTAGSYFYEAFETYSTIEDVRSLSSLKYMLLCKIMCDAANEVPALIDTKATSILKHANTDLEAMRAVASAYLKRSLEELQTVLNQYKKELQGDAIVATHIQSLYSNLLEQNLLRLTEPFARVEIAHIAALINLDVTLVENKLSQMILDKKFNGILDQGAGCLIAYENTPEDPTYPAALETIQHMGAVVNALYERAAHL